MRSEPAIFVGSSHLVCLGVPLRSPAGDISLLPVDESEGRFLYLNGPFPRDEDYWAEAERLAGRHRLFICWRGNQHMAEFLLASEPAFDFILSEQPDLPIAEGAVLVPELMMIEKFAPSFDRLDALLHAATRNPLGAVMCGTPPPKESIEVIRASLAKEDYFVERLAALATTPEEVAITPTIVLYKMWRLVQRSMQEIAARHGVPFAAVPPQALAPNGYLHEACWATDVTHANRHFGRLLLASCRQYL